MAKINVKGREISIINKKEEDYICLTDKDIAFEFASWVSVEFKLYLIKEFQRLKEDERKQLGCCLLYTSPSPRDRTRSRMPSSA